MRLIKSAYDVKDIDSAIIIDASGNNLGKMSIRKALDKAKEYGMDLVQVSEDSNSSVFKILDYGKMKYEKSKKNRMSKSKKNVEKSIFIHLTTSEHDLDIKKRKIREFLKDGHSVKFAMELRGRECNNIKFAIEHFKKQVESFNEIANVSEITNSNRNILVYLTKK